MKIYIAGSISGLSYDEVYEYFKSTSKALSSAGFDVLSPMTGKLELRTELEFKSHGYENVPVATNHAIFNRDRWMVSSADIIYANLTKCNGRVSIGTCMELAWAFQQGKHVVLAMDDDNVHQHAFVIEAAHVIFKSHKDAMDYIIGLKNK